MSSTYLFFRMRKLLVLRMTQRLVQYCFSVISWRRPRRPVFAGIKGMLQVIVRAMDESNLRVISRIQDSQFLCVSRCFFIRLRVTPSTETHQIIAIRALFHILKKATKSVIHLANSFPVLQMG